MIGDLDDPEVELGLDPELGEGGEEERILGGRGKADEDDDDDGNEDGVKCKRTGAVGTKAGTFKELHKRLVELKADEDDGVDVEDSKEKVHTILYAFIYETFILTFLSYSQAARLARQRAEINKLLEVGREPISWVSFSDFSLVLPTCSLNALRNTTIWITRITLVASVRGFDTRR